MTMPHAPAGPSTPLSIFPSTILASSPSRLLRDPPSVRFARVEALPLEQAVHLLQPVPTRAPECKAIPAGAPLGIRAGSEPSDAAPFSRISGLPDSGAPDPRAQARCRMVAEVVEELTMMVGDRPQLRRDRRRMMVHVRQIAMYVSHVVLQVTMTDIGLAFGRDRSTVSYSCHVVEDRRDDADFDAFVSVIERVIGAVFPPAAIADQRNGT
ncbi:MULTISPECIES: helix-turn-helix domain-containing protein [unclassified Rhizobium]|uniref:helix-turn-helix domain-containing protein n=1 Tax=unclassified Rhizobium TaxID=2613769 RepID=UPI000AED06D7|nr:MULTISPECIES: helix-turn-helix domain-containing protein [unclassified Rhizobium]